MLNPPPYAKPTAVPGHSATCGCVHCFQAAHAAAREMDHALTVKCLKGTVTKADMAATSKAWSDLWARDTGTKRPPSSACAFEQSECDECSDGRPQNCHRM